jgi:thiamine-phosphate pyrophosphorylase
MTVAELGADYVMFGEPDRRGHRLPLETILDRVEWWSEVFQVPCIGYAASLDDIAPLSAAGADFVALAPAILEDARGLPALLDDAVTRLVRRVRA